MRKPPHYHQGKFKPKFPSKYIGDPKQIIYRSGLELKHFKRVDINKNILKWGSEEFYIPYFSPIDNKTHKYFIDLVLKIKKPDGSIKTFLAEIKPSAQCPKTINEDAPQPRQGKNKKSYLYRLHMWLVNKAKWEATRKYCKEHNFGFIFLTEKDLP